ncbi:MAG: class I SAM-dependent methyltransferase [Burkholderiales bacterium]|nr:class I SAM-dependent methyltransferase [Burkholderiales bacterium]
MNEFDEKYVAPAPARWTGNGAVPASAHDAPAATDDAIPCYLAFAPVEDGPTRARLGKLVALARGGMGWKEALESTEEAGMRAYVTDMRRAGFLELLPLGAQSDILEIGPGLGQFTVALAQRSRHVHALEVVPEQAEFALVRARQEGARNVSIAIGGDDCRLPYRDASFDGVVLNLVFEWCGSRIESESHGAAQTRLLHEMVRVLKPGGFLYLATKNRFALRLLLGGADEHMANVRFGSALPRRLGAWRLRRKGQQRAMGKLYSHDDLREQLHRAGLGDVESFWAAPEMRFPTHYVPTDAASVRAARAAPGLRQGEGRKVNLLMRFVPAAWVRHVMPGLAFLARKGGAGAAGSDLRRAGSAD